MKKKGWIFLIVALVNLVVILSFIYFTKRIRNDRDIQVMPESGATH